MKPINYFLKNLFLKVLLLFQKKTTYLSNFNLNSDSKVLFIRLNNLGDALISTPVIKRIKEATNCKTFVLSSRRNSKVFSNNDFVDRTVVFNKGFSGFKEVIEFIKNEKIDVIIDLHDDVSTTVSFIIALAPVKVKAGLRRSNEAIYNLTIERKDAKSYHIVERLMDLVKLFNIDFNNDEVSIVYKLSQDSIGKAKKFVKDSFIEEKFLTGINISAGGNARFWGIEKYREIISLLSNRNMNLFLFCSPDELTIAKKITENRIPVFAPDFDTMAATVSIVNLLISPDTSVVHIASAFKTPVFGLYVHYNTDDMIWSPYNTKFSCAITKESNLNNVTVDEVWKKLSVFTESLQEQKNI